MTSRELAFLHARLGQGAGLVGLGAAGFAALLVSPAAGAVLMVVAALVLGFYSSLHLLWARQVELPGLAWLATLFEGVLPALAFWAMAGVAGPAFALESWVIPQLSAFFVAASLLRLMPAIPLLLGLGSAVLYGLVWWTEVGRLALAEGALTEEALYDPGLPLAHMGTLSAMGLVCGLGARRLRAMLIAYAQAQQARESALKESEPLARYRLGREIASGGMGRVLEAAHCPEGGFERRVAMKVLHPHLASQPAYVDRFRTEAEITARLTHPNIVAALDFGRIGETWFLVMEYIDGRTLADILNERRRLDRPLPPRVVAWLGQEIASALDHAHRGAHDENGQPLRVVHRDLSPSNVLLDRTGTVRITDFGVARMLRTEVLITDTLVGKPAYVAPEILRDHRTDERADLWSLGVLLWEALANRRLFSKESEAASLLAVLEDPIEPVSTLREGLCSEWDPLFARLLARDPEQRIASAAEVCQALGAIAQAEGPVLAHDLRELLMTEETLEELELDAEHEGEPEAQAGAPAAEDQPSEQEPSSSSSES